MNSVACQKGAEYLFTSFICVSEFKTCVMVMTSANFKYVVNAGVIASISQEKQINLPATPKSFKLLVLPISVNKRKRVKHCEGKECTELMHDQSTRNTT